MARNARVAGGAGRGSLELVGREVPEPGSGEVRVRVEACGGSAS